MDSPKPAPFEKLRDVLTLLLLLILLAIVGFLCFHLYRAIFGSAFQPRSFYFIKIVCDFWALWGALKLLALDVSPEDLLMRPPSFQDIWRRWRGFKVGLSLVLGWASIGWLTSYISLLPKAYGWLLYVLIPIPMFLSGAFILAMLAGFCVAVIWFFVSGPMAIFARLAEFDRLWTIYKHNTAGIVGYVLRLAYWLSGIQPPPPAPDDEKGARFSDIDEISNLLLVAEKGAEEKDSRIVCGHVEDASNQLRPFKIHTEKHVLIMASTRSGKGVALIIPHLLRYAGSAFVLDPKGENARATGRQRAMLNDKVHYLDPFGISGKPQARFNPLARFTLENMEAESKALAAALVMGHEGGGQRDHWTSSAMQLLAALILYVFTSPHIPPLEKDLPTVRRLLLRNMNQVLADMLKSNLADGLLASLATSFLDTPEKEYGSILSTAQRETEILDNPFIAACLSASGDGEEVDFSAWKNGTMTVYLCLSAPKFPVFSRWLRLVLTAALDEMTDTLSPPPLPVCFMLDELATLGHLTAVENAVGLAAGYGVQLFTVFQDVAQMKDLYRGRWASFIGNAGIRALFNLDDYETAKYWSDSLGGHIVQTTGRQEDIYGYSRGQNVGETLRPLLSPDEIMLYLASKMKIDGQAVEPEKMLVLLQGSHPIIAERVPYYQDESLAGLWDDPRGGGQLLPPRLKDENIVNLDESDEVTERV